MAPDELIRGLLEHEQRLGEAAIDEAAAAAPGEGASAALEQAIQASQSSDVVVDLGVAAMVKETAARSGLEPPWATAERELAA